MESRHLYNEMLARVKEHYAQAGEFLFKYALTALFKGRGGENVPASTVQTLADRLDKALRRYIARKDIGQTVGFPRFKSANRWHSIRLRQYGKGHDVYLTASRLKVPKKLGKSIKIKQHRPLEGSPKSACLKRRADGNWYVLITCELQDQPLTLRDKPDVGLDVGLRHFLADSEGNVVSNPRHLRKSQKRLRRAQRKLARRTKGSHRRKKAARSVARVHLKVARQRKDFLHKTAKTYAEDYNLIVVEKLNVSGMAKNRTLARDIQDAGWAMFVRILEYKAEEAGTQVVKVPAYHTTQECSECGELVPKSLSVRRHNCPFCGYEEDRDVNAARNIKSRGASGTPLSTMAGMPPSEHKVKDNLELAPRSLLL